jgi:hypothetical protein
MSTFGTMLDRIADELSRTDLDSQTRLCIRTAIQHYQRKRFYFIEDYGTTFSTVAGQEYYSSSDNAAIPNFSEVDSLVITALGSRWPLTKRGKEWMDEVSTSSDLTGIPSDYGYYSRQFRLYPIPQAVYSIRVSGLKRQDTLSATADTNVWLTEGESLIRNAAKRILAIDYLRNAGLATDAAAQEKIALDLIVSETEMRGSSGFTPTSF